MVLETSVANIGSAKARGLRGGVLHGATEGQLRAFEQNLAAGISEEDAYDLLAESILIPASKVRGTYERIDVRAR